MQRQLLPITFFLILGILVTACTLQLPPPVPFQSEPAADHLNLMDSLQAAGTTAELVGEVSQPFFTVNARVLRVNGEDVQVFEYADSAAAQSDATRVSPDGYVITVPDGPVSHVSWIATPHFFRQGALIVLYVGENANVIRLLETTLGSAFAGGERPTSDLPAEVEAALGQLGMRFRVADRDAIQLIDWAYVDWPNGCLGIEVEDISCTEAIVPGYRIVVEIDGHEYEYRSTLLDEHPYLLLLAAGPQPQFPDPVIKWEGDHGLGCQSLTVGSDGKVAAGPCGFPQTPLRVNEEMRRHEQLAYWLDRFAPFEAATDWGNVAFHGQGEEAASPAWQRAIAAWARLVQLEATSGRGGASWGMAASWSQELADRPGYCEFLQVEVYGYAFAATARCEGGDAQEMARGWLSTADWEQLDAWLQERTAVHMPNLVFNGQGAAEWSQEDIAMLSGWLGSLYESLLDTQSTPHIRGQIVSIDRAEGSGQVLGRVRIEGVLEGETLYDQAVATITSQTKIVIQTDTGREVGNFDSLVEGQRVAVWFTGPVMESYPVQATADYIEILW